MKILVLPFLDSNKVSWCRNGCQGFWEFSPGGADLSLVREELLICSSYMKLPKGFFPLSSICLTTFFSIQSTFCSHCWPWPWAAKRVVADLLLMVGRKASWCLLIPRAPGDPRSCQMDGCATSTNIGSWFSRYTCKKASGQGVRTHPPMVLLAMVRER